MSSEKEINAEQSEKERRFEAARTYTRERYHELYKRLGGREGGKGFLEKGTSMPNFEEFMADFEESRKDKPL